MDIILHKRNYTQTGNKLNYLCCNANKLSRVQFIRLITYIIYVNGSIWLSVTIYNNCTEFRNTIYKNSSLRQIWKFYPEFMKQISTMGRIKRNENT